MKKNWIRKLIGGLSFTSALFIFQACYGTPQDLQPDLLIEGQVKARSSGSPIEGIKVTLADNMQFITTDDKGRFSFYTLMRDPIEIRFQDIDSTQNGLFAERDTVLTGFDDAVFLDISLEEK